MILAPLAAWILMLSVGSIGLGWGYWPCLGLVAVLCMCFPTTIESKS